MKTIVLVTNQFECERIILAGKAIADITGTELCVFSVQNNKYPPNPDALEHLFNVSKNHHAVMNVTYSDDPKKQIISFIKHNQAHNVLTGIPAGENSLLYDIWKKFTHIQFFTVDEEGTASPISRRDMILKKQTFSLTEAGI